MERGRERERERGREREIEREEERERERESGRVRETAKTIMECQYLFQNIIDIRLQDDR